MKKSNTGKVLEEYTINAEGSLINIKIFRDPKDFVLNYKCELPKIEPATLALLEEIRNRLIREVKVKIEEILDPKAYEELKEKYKKAAEKLIETEIPGISKKTKSTLLNYLIHKMLGLGQIEPLFYDDNIEEIVINTAEEPVWIYHKKYGWLKTNIKVESEMQTHNFASVIGRRVGKAITNLTPLMDARLPNGDRVNATLFPISTKGNTLTIRKFARTPWTVIDFIDPKINSLSIDLAALLWFSIQNELNLLIAGGTGSGKTSMLNALTSFIPPNQRIISIEDTRELQLPKFLHWIPMVTRSPNPEGKGEIGMIDLMINSLRMRPDRVIVGEVRRAKEAEVLFEAMHTGHSVYSTFHANTVSQVYRRFINPPIMVPEEMLEALHLVLVQFRQRRLNIRRTFQVAEVEIPEETVEGLKIKFNLLYKWQPRSDKIISVNPSERIMKELEMRAGMTQKEINRNLKEKQDILKWMLKNNVRDIDRIGRIVSSYYIDEDQILEGVKKNITPYKIIKKI